MKTLRDLLYFEELKHSVMEDILDMERDMKRHDNADYMSNVMYWSLNLTQQYLRKKFNIDEKQLRRYAQTKNI